MTPELLAQVAPQLQALGKLDSISLQERTSVNGGALYSYTARFSAGTHKINIFIAPDGKVGGYRVLP